MDRLFEEGSGNVSQPTSLWEAMVLSGLSPQSLAKSKGPATRVNLWNLVQQLGFSPTPAPSTSVSLTNTSTEQCQWDSSVPGPGTNFDFTGVAINLWIYIILILVLVSVSCMVRLCLRCCPANNNNFWLRICYGCYSARERTLLIARDNVTGFIKRTITKKRKDIERLAGQDGVLIWSFGRCLIILSALMAVVSLMMLLPTTFIGGMTIDIGAAVWDRTTLSNLDSSSTNLDLVFTLLNVALAMAFIVVMYYAHERSIKKPPLTKAVILMPVTQDWRLLAESLEILHRDESVKVSTICAEKGVFVENGSQKLPTVFILAQFDSHNDAKSAFRQGFGGWKAVWAPAVLSDIVWPCYVYNKRHSSHNIRVYSVSILMFLFTLATPVALVEILHLMGNWTAEHSYWFPLIHCGLTFTLSFIYGMIDDFLYHSTRSRRHIGTLVINCYIFMMTELVLPFFSLNEITFMWLLTKPAEMWNRMRCVFRPEMASNTANSIISILLLRCVIRLTRLNLLATSFISRTIRSSCFRKPLTEEDYQDMMDGCSEYDLGNRYAEYVGAFWLAVVGGTAVSPLVWPVALISFVTYYLVDKAELVHTSSPSYIGDKIHKMVALFAFFPFVISSGILMTYNLWRNDALGRIVSWPSTVISVAVFAFVLGTFVIKTVVFVYDHYWAEFRLAAELKDSTLSSSSSA